MYKKNIWGSYVNDPSLSDEENRQNAAKANALITKDKLEHIEDGIYDTGNSQSTLPVIRLTGDFDSMSGDDSVVMEFDYNDGIQHITGYTDSHWQGDSSQAYPKKNLTLKLYQDEAKAKKLKFKPTSTWKKDHKFNLKANWIDRTEARNLVNAKLIHQATISRPLYMGNSNLVPASRANVSIDGKRVSVRIGDLYGKTFLGSNDNYFTVSFDASLTEDLGKDSEGNSLNVISSSLYDQSGGMLYERHFDLSDVSAGTKKHFSFYGKTDTQGYRYMSGAYFDVGGSISKPATGKAEISNVAIYLGKGEPDGYTYVPSIYDNRQAFLNAPYGGQVQGIPVKVIVNDKDQGLYTLNTKKGETIVGMDEDNKTNALISIAETSMTFNKSTPYKIDGTDAEFEVSGDNDSNRDAFNRLASFVKNSTNDDFVAHIADYVDLYSVIDSYIATFLMNNIDGGNKSLLYATYDNVHFIAIPYDLDSTWSLQWDGSRINGPWTAQVSYNLLTQRVESLFQQQVIDRYNYLRQYIFSGAHITNEFEKYIESIPYAEYINNETIWPNIPSIELTDFVQIKSAIMSELSATDKNLVGSLSYSVDSSTTQ